MGSSAGVGPEIKTELGSDGVLLATIDMPGRSMNVFSAALMNALQALLHEVQTNSAIRAVVLCSGKAAFLAGADLEMVRSFTERAQTDSPQDLHQLCGRLGRLFRRLETNGKPFVAAIHGLALGGGLEVALACHARVAADQTDVGLPEIKLGLLPGAGGTQRLPRLIGRRAALQLMLQGDPIPAAKAQSLGIVDAVAPREHLVAQARARALELAARGSTRASWDSDAWTAPAHEGDDNVESLLAQLKISEQDRRRYPAYQAILNCVADGWGKPMDAACSWEMDCFVRLIQDPTAGNMIRSLFLDRQRASKLIPAGDQPPRAVVLGKEADTVSALLRASRVQVMEPNTPGCVVIVTDDSPADLDTASGLTIRWRQGPAGKVMGPAVWVSDLTAYGRAIEVIADNEGRGREAGLQIARWLRATPIVSQGASILPDLALAKQQKAGAGEAAQLEAIATAASDFLARNPHVDTGIADSAAVIAGLLPAYTGGPFTYLRQHGNAHGH